MQDALRIKLLPGAQNLVHHAAVRLGSFARHGIRAELAFTRDYAALRAELAAGSVQIAHAAVDHAVVMKKLSGVDVVVVAGGCDSMNELLAQPHVASVADLRGGTLAVEGLQTAYTLQLRQVLARHGLDEDAYSLVEVGGGADRMRALLASQALTASLLGPPYSVSAQAAGKRSLLKVRDVLGPYQSTGCLVRRDWMTGNRSTLVRYIAALVQASRWILDPKNRDENTRLLAQHFDLDPETAVGTYDRLVAPGFGLASDLGIDAAGFASVLQLRALASPVDWGTAQEYVDDRCWREAIATLA